MNTFGRENIKNQWLAYHSMALNVISVLIILSLIIVIVILARRERPEPLLLSFDNPRNTFVKIIPFRKNIAAMQNMMELQARQYVVLRETVDLATENSRYAQVLLMSSEQIGSKFAENMAPANKQSPLYKYKKQKLVRRVKIVNSFNLSPITNAWQIEWEQETSEQATGKIVSTTSFISKIQANLEDKKISYDNRFLNVNGFSVNQYLTSKKG